MEKMEVLTGSAYLVPGVFPVKILDCPSSKHLDKPRSVIFGCM